MRNRRPPAWLWLACALPLALPLSCASNGAARRQHLVAENLSYAAAHKARGEKGEAAQLYEAVLLAEPAHEKAREGLAEIGPHAPSILEPDLLGFNRVRAPRAPSSSWRFILYPVNRILDLLDVVTVRVGLEGGLYAEAHATRALQAGIGAGGGFEIGWSQKRELAVGTTSFSGLALGPVSLEEENWSRAGTGGLAGHRFSVAGLNAPSDFVYQRHRDYWGIGARVILLLVGVEVEVHPVELADAVSGFFLADFLQDDIGTTRSLRLSAAEIQAMTDLLDTLSPAQLRLNRRLRAAPLSPPAEGQEPPAPPATPASQ